MDWCRRGLNNEESYQGYPITEFLACKDWCPKVMNIRFPFVVNQLYFFKKFLFIVQVSTKIQLLCSFNSVIKQHEKAWPGDYQKHVYFLENSRISLQQISKYFYQIRSHIYWKLSFIKSQIRSRIRLQKFVKWNTHVRWTSQLRSIGFLLSFHHYQMNCNSEYLLIQYFLYCNKKLYFQKNLIRLNILTQKAALLTTKICQWNSKTLAFPQQQKTYTQLQFDIRSHNTMQPQGPELDFDAILRGEDPTPKQVKKEPSLKVAETDARKRQQSCQVKDVDKDLLPSTNYTPNSTGFRVSLSDMLGLDRNDESLQNYKKTLLGNIKQEELKEDEAAQVEILKIEVICEGRPKGNIVLDFQGEHVGKNAHKFVIKEGGIYNLRVFFTVKYDIVYGLKMTNNVYKTFMKVQKDQQKMGSFSPTQKPHVFDLPREEAPSGFLARGDYKGKMLFVDSEGMVHCQFDYILSIEKDWN